MKVLGALESAQLEWFLDAGKPTASSYVYRVIYVSDLKQVQVSDGTNWVPFLNTSTNQTLSGDITFAGQQIFNGLHRLSVTTNSATGPITALAPTTPVTEFTGAVTSVSGITSGASGATVMLINRSGNPFTVLDEDTGATAGNRIRTGTGASISITNNSSVLLTYAGDSRWHVVGSVGSSSAGGSKNYFAVSSANPNFSQNSVSPWSACTLTLTSGIPSGAPTLSASQMAIATTGTNPLLVSQSNYNLQLTKSAANAQGQGFISGALTIDREDLAKVLTGSFSYEVVSGTVDFSGQSTQSLEIWVYNTVSGAWTQPAGYRGMNTGSGQGKVVFTFQSDSTAANNSYKIAVITAQTSASAYVVNFNDFAIGPSAVINGTPVTDWQSYTPTFTAFGTVTNIEFQWRRVGSDVEIRGKFNLGVTTGSEARITLPPGLTSADTARIPSIQIVGYGVKNNFTTTQYAILQEPSVAYHTFGTQSGATSGLTKSIGTDIGSTGQLFSYFARIPVQGWSSTLQMSNDTDTRVVAFASTGSVPAVTAGNPMIYPTVTFDTHGAYNSSTGKYTIPVSGTYKIRSTSAGNPALYTSVNVYKNNSIVLPGSGSADANGYIDGQFLLQLNAGDIVDVRPTNTISAGSTTKNLFSIERLSGPSVIAATESVNASYYLSASFASSPTVPINFDTKEFDSHNAVTTSPTAWKFTAPVSGTYDVGAYFYPTAGASNLNLYKNGSLYKVVAYAVNGTSKSSGVVPIKLNAGDYVDLRTDGSTTVTGGAQTSTNTAWFQVKRTGN